MSRDIERFVILWVWDNGRGDTVSQLVEDEDGVRYFDSIEDIMAFKENHSRSYFANWLVINLQTLEAEEVL